MTTRRWLFVLLCSFEWLVPSDAAATPIAYDEGISGDLSNLVLAPTALGSLDIGLNTIRGGVSVGNPDYYSVVLPGSLQLTSIVYIITSPTPHGFGSIFGASGGTLIAGPNAIAAAQLGSGLPVAPFSAPGTYTFASGADFSGWSYEWRLTTVVPEPSAVLLVGASIAATWARRRRS